MLLFLQFWQDHKITQIYAIYEYFEDLRESFIWLNETQKIVIQMKEISIRILHISVVLIEDIRMRESIHSQRNFGKRKLEVYAFLKMWTPLFFSSARTLKQYLVLPFKFIEFVLFFSIIFHSLFSFEIFLVIVIRFLCA